MGEETKARQLGGVEPATGRPLPEVPIATPAEVHAAVARARAAQPRWAALSWDERRERLLKLREVLLRRREELYDVLCAETGKPRFEALAHELFPIVDLTHYFARNAEQLLDEEELPLHLFGPLKKSSLVRVPRGVIAVISPWNFPFTIPMGDVVMALLARNAVVVKPSEWTPRTMLLAKRLLDEAGIDPDLVQIVPGDGATGAALLDAKPDMVIFTGSVPTGRRVAAACGERLIPFVAELGGKNPAIVMPDADPDEVAAWLVWGAFANSGQICASIERCLIPEAMREVLVPKIVARTMQLRQGASEKGKEGEIDVGAMVFPRQREIVIEHVADARARGAKILCGGEAFGEGGARFFQPTVIADVPKEAKCWQHEFFGPLLPIRTYRTVEEAIAEANDTDCGLQAYVFGRSVSEAERVARRLEAGSVIVNDLFSNHAMPETPWGGVKTSGIGRVHGADGLKDLCQLRHVSRPRVHWNPPWRFPYRRSVFRGLEGAVTNLYRGALSWFL